MLNVKEITFRPKSGASGKNNADEFYHRPRIYIHLDGETIRVNLEKRRERPYSIYKKEVLPQVWRALGLNGNEIKVGWSQKAGCSCSCSPGFVVKDDGIPWDLHITVTERFVRGIEISGTIRQ